MRTVAAITAGALLVTAPASAQDVAGELDKLFAWATSSTPGCVVGVSQNGHVLVNRAYGMADLARNVPLTTQSLFDIGSTHKQFVAAAVLLLVEDGRISLTDDIRKYIPELPDYGHTITIDHLLTHTSGIRDWVWLSSVTGGKEDVLTLILRQRGLNFAPGTEWSYSSSGFVLAKEIVARVSGQTFAEFARQRIFEPLGMNSTRYAHDVLAVDNAALAYEKEGERWTPAMRLGNERGGGGVFSTTGDLLIWNDALTNKRLGAFVSDKLQEPARLANGRTLSYARGLILDADGDVEIVWHSGSAAAYESMLARFPKQGLSLAILCNAGEVADNAADERRIIDLFMPASARAAAAPRAAQVGGVELSAAELNEKAGLFFSERTGQPLRIIVNGGRLRIPGGPLLVPVSKDRFRNERRVTQFMSNDEFELHFVARDVLELKSMEGEITRYQRAQPYAPGATELAAFAGRYYTDEIGALELIATANGLAGRLNDSQTLTFMPVHPDVFQLGQMTIRFRRDATGKVIGAELSNPVLRNAYFPRESDPANAVMQAPRNW